MRQFDQKPSLDELMHHGVKGMKWGVRKQESKSTARVGESLDITTPKGSKVHLEESLPGPVRRSLAVVNPHYRKALEQSRSFVISVDNKRVGRVSLREKSKDEVNFVWIGVNPKHRGKGYASTIFDAGLEYSKQKGYSRITLEVPGNAPDARHIYEKRGFKQSGPMQGNKNDLWGGLTPMSYDIPKDRALNHADGITDSEMENALEQTFAPLGINETMFSDDLTHENHGGLRMTKIVGDSKPPLDELSHVDDESEILHMMAVGEEFLEHHGIKGMKWGVRKAGSAISATSRAQTKTAKAVGRGTVKVAKATGSGSVKVAKATGRGIQAAHFVGTANSQRNVERIVTKAQADYKAKDLPGINAKYGAAAKRTQRLKNPLDPTTKAYRQEARTAYIKRLEQSANSIKSPSGNMKYTVRDVNNKLPTSKYQWDVSVAFVKHAAGEVSGFQVAVNLDDNGFITGLGSPVFSVAQ